MNFLHAREALIEAIEKHALAVGPLCVLEVGGGEALLASKFRKGRIKINRYTILDIDVSRCREEGIEKVERDICAPLTDWKHSDSFDVVLSYNVFEHLRRPWKAAENCALVTKPGGLNLHQTVFAWRYHPVPSDYFRFTCEGLSSLFEDTGSIEKVVCGYDIRRRRRSKGPELPDNLGGWIENWEVLYIGRKSGR